MDLEIIDYDWDLEGAAFDATGKLVDAAYLRVQMRRRHVTAEGPDGPLGPRITVTPAGAPVPLRIAVDTLAAKDKAALLAAFEEVEALVARHAKDHYVAATSDESALDAKLAAVESSRRDRAEHEQAVAAAKTELALLTAMIAEKREEVSP